MTRARLEGARREALRLVALLLISVLALQLCFLARIALMATVDPQSTTFQRSEAWRLLREPQRLVWRRSWVDHARIAPSLKRAVIAAEDAGFTEHRGVEWDALKRAWGRNQRTEARIDAANVGADQRQRRAAAGHPIDAKRAAPRPPELVGASTITQQLAKNLLLAGERTWLRKSQELVIAFMLEALLAKPRILEIYLNHVEWGEGVFGAQAAAQHYFRVDAIGLNASQAARLAVLLPAPKRFEKHPASAYLLGRAGAVEARMDAVDLP